MTDYSEHLKQIVDTREFYVKARKNAEGMRALILLWREPSKEELKAIKLFSLHGIKKIRQYAVIKMFDIGCALCLAALDKTCKTLTENEIKLSEEYSRVYKLSTTESTYGQTKIH